MVDPQGQKYQIKTLFANSQRKRGGANDAEILKSVPEIIGKQEDGGEDL